MPERIEIEKRGRIEECKLPNLTTFVELFICLATPEYEKEDDDGDDDDGSSRS